jgi:hypothetical protein
VQVGANLGILNGRYRRLAYGQWFIIFERTDFYDVLSIALHLLKYLRPVLGNFRSPHHPVVTIEVGQIRFAQIPLQLPFRFKLIMNGWIFGE